jgi:HNH endonuclease/AP2 domain
MKVAISIRGSGKPALVDSRFAGLVSSFDWSLSPGDYAWAHRPEGGMVMMHLLVWHLAGKIVPDGYVVDHVNRERLDNRLRHLRLLTFAQNNMNREIDNRNSSGYKGVCWDESHNMWRGVIRHRKQQHHLGYYDTPEEAAVAYNLAAEKFYGADIPVFNSVRLERAIRVPRNASKFVGIAYWDADDKPTIASQLITRANEPVVNRRVYDRYAHLPALWIYTSYAEASRYHDHIQSAPLVGAPLIARTLDSYLVVTT